MRLAGHVRDETTGVGIAGVTVNITRADSGTVIGSAVTNGFGRFEYDYNGSPGPVQWTATYAGKTRTIAGNTSIQADVFFTGELPKLFEGFGSGCLSGIDNQLAITASGMVVVVGTGGALVKGSPYIVYGAPSPGFVVASNGAGTTRYDRIVVRVTRTGSDKGAAVAALVQGVAGAGEPALTQNATTWEMELALVTIAPGATNLAAAITDRRTFLEYGLSTMTSLDDWNHATPPSGSVARFNGTVWESYTPNPVVMDEAHRLSSPGANVTSTVSGGQGVADLTLALTLANGVRYDVWTYGSIMALSAVGQSISAAADIDGGVYDFMDHGSSGAYLPLSFAGTANGKVGTGATITVRCKMKVSGGTGLIASGVILAAAVPRT